MPDKKLPISQIVYHAIPETKVHNRTIAQLLTIASYDQGPEWIMTRRFAHPRGGKSPATAAAEIHYRRKLAIEADPGLGRVPLVKTAIFKVTLGSSLVVLSVLDATNVGACTAQFLRQYAIAPALTLDPGDYRPSHRIGNLVDADQYAGIEYPSVRRPGGANYLLYSPLPYVDAANSPNDPDQLV